MNNFFYARIAAINIKKNGKFYLPYIITCTGTIMMFYLMCFLTASKGIENIGHYEILRTIMTFGSIVIGIFATILLFYANSFLIKRRKKEFGLFNILGMEKKHLARVIATENFFIAIISLILGLAFGILFSKLMILLLLKLLTFEVTFGFEISVKAILITAILFGSIFILTLLRNLRQIHLSKPIELLQGGNVGEKEPKTKWLLALIGFVTLGAGYAVANIVKSPLEAIGWFFIAVILVIIGTYCLFTAGSIALLKMLRMKKNFYYTAKHFTSVSGMIYRMKQNAVGLANICILSTMVLVILSTTISLYIGFGDALTSMYPRCIEVDARQISKEENDTLTRRVDNVITANNLKATDKIEYRYINYAFTQAETVFTYSHESSYIDSDTSVVYFITIDEYNRMQGTAAALGENEVMVYSPDDDFNYDSVSFNGKVYSVKAQVDSLKIQDSYNAKVTKNFYFLVQDEEAIKEIHDNVTGGNDPFKGLSYYCAFDIDGDSNRQIEFSDTLSNSLSDITQNTNILVYVSSREFFRIQFLSVYGGLFFIGIFLGALFIMATVLIMYYKQISEGYDDKQRFEIMQKVGMNKEEIKSSIRSQVLLVFFLPLAAACIHIGAAFKMITKLLAVFGLTDIALFSICTASTILIFAVLYGIVYILTARVYYKIIS